MPQVDRAIFGRNERRAALRLQREARSTALRLKNPPPPPKPTCIGCDDNSLESYMHATWCPGWHDHSGDLSGA